MRYILAVAALILSVLGASAFAAEPVRIGALVSVTGPAAFLGSPERNGILLLQEAINAEGGILGRPLEMVVYDTESDRSKAVEYGWNLLHGDRVVAALGCSTTGHTLAIMDSFAKAGIPLVSMAVAEKVVTPVNPWIFKVTQSDRQAVRRILAHASGKGFAKLAIITVSDEYGQAGREVLKELIGTGGFNLVADEVYGPADTDMTAQLGRIADAGADALICWGTSPGPAAIAVDRARLGLKSFLYMSHAVASKEFLELAGKAAEGVVLPASKLIVADQLPDSDPQKALLVSYAQSYTSRFGAEPSQFAGYGFDALLLTFKAIEAAGSSEPADIRAALEKIEGQQGVTGVFKMSPTDHNGLSESSLVMVEVAEGKWRILPGQEPSQEKPK